MKALPQLEPERRYLSITVSEVNIDVCNNAAQDKHIPQAKYPPSKGLNFFLSAILLGASILIGRTHSLEGTNYHISMTRHQNQIVTMPSE